ncbi:NAD(P)-dependent oxidoreductase [Streptomyces ipomoeae]|uniref:NAD(P)-dependent oxidoreductase n=1 Tax=Streptomyces ipomoeae TaxID=103232 RepID=UPI0011472700|nr:NAD(P)H-binding protein [Streptomyces ipomoeae]MDX2939630.1 NAD(P)H-binding protein [Streptomyces ipomoeae]TQE31949.1 NAD-dependent epimerase/dehydratase family protein [Streptomyces ipomoeae]
MSKTVVFGAGGRAGRQAVAEALRRGHTVTAVVRDPAKYPDLSADGVRVVAGDVTDAEAVTALVAGQDAVISAAVENGSDPQAFFTDSSRALLGAVRKSGARRLVVVGTVALLHDASGARLLDSPVLAEAREFCLGHETGLELLRAEGPDVDWLYVSPSGVFDEDGGRSGNYRVADHGDWTDKITYEDLAVALLDEIERPAHHRVHLAVTG